MYVYKNLNLAKYFNVLGFSKFLNRYSVVINRKIIQEEIYLQFFKWCLAICYLFADTGFIGAVSFLKNKNYYAYKVWNKISISYLNWIFKMIFFSQSGNVTCNYTCTFTCLAITPSFRILSAFNNPLAKESIAPACKGKQSNICNSCCKSRICNTRDNWKTFEFSIRLTYIINNIGSSYIIHVN